MNRGECLLRTLKIAEESFPTMLAIMKYEESDFLGVICAMIDIYATTYDRNKVDLGMQIYKELKRDNEQK